MLLRMALSIDDCRVAVSMANNVTQFPSFTRCLDLCAVRRSFGAFLGRNIAYVVARIRNATGSINFRWSLRSLHPKLLKDENVLFISRDNMTASYAVSLAFQPRFGIRIISGTQLGFKRSRNLERLALKCYNYTTPPSNPQCRAL
jgi:hypothetical protein